MDSGMFFSGGSPYSPEDLTYPSISSKINLKRNTGGFLGVVLADLPELI